MVRSFDSYIQKFFYPTNKHTRPILLCGTAVVATVVGRVVGDEVVDAEVVGDEVVDAEVVGGEVVGGKLVDGGVLALCRQTSHN